MMALLYIIAMLLLFSASIFVHELGHFLAARALGLVADVFSIGMGKAVWKRKVGATVWQIGWLPFGGFVALPQMDPNSFLEGKSSGDGVQDSGADNQRPTTNNHRFLPRVAPWRKIVVSVAGAAGNVVFAFLLAAIVWIVGKPSSLQERNGVVGFIATNSPALALGLVPGDEITAVDGHSVRNWTEIAEKVALAPGDAVLLRVRAPDQAERDLSIGVEKAAYGLRMLPGIEGMDPCFAAAVSPGSGAAAAGLQPGDQILRFDGQKVFSRAHLSQLVEAAAGRPAPIEVLRAGAVVASEVESAYDAKLERHLIGIQFNTIGDLDFAVRSHPTPWAQVRGHATSIFSFLRALATPSTSGAAADAVGGPILILLMLWLMLKASFVLGISFTVFLNVNLAIINLLPIPVLDGGHVVMSLYEWIARRPPPPKFVNALYNVVVVLIIALFILLVFRDSIRYLVPSVKEWVAGAKP
ncbi:MAG: RIP metalloprotease RseP [Kiritimatiellia bacterium]